MRITDWKRHGALAVAFVLLQGVVRAEPAADYRQAFEFAKQQLERMCAVAGNGYPYYTAGGQWKTSGPDGWTAGYFPGMLWMVYAQTKDPVWRDRAKRWTEPIAAVRNSDGPLNFGILFKPTFGEAYRLTGDRPARQIALDAAASMARRYMPEGKYVRSWGKVDDPRQQGIIIIDCLIDLSLLFWAAKEDANPFYFEIAHNTALTMLRTTVRDDGSSIQVIELDPHTGQKLWDRVKQGYSIESCWSRAQGWGLYAFPEIYRYTKDYRFLKTAQKMAAYYLAHVPADLVPYWDFQAPNIPNEPKDTSAAALAAAGLWELAKWTTDPALQKRYREMSVRTVDSLTRNYLATGQAQRNGRLLVHATLHKPAGLAVDESLIVGDYYYLEALLNVMGQ